MSATICVCRRRLFPSRREFIFERGPLRRHGRRVARCLTQCSRNNNLIRTRINSCIAVIGYHTPRWSARMQGMYGKDAKRISAHQSAISANCLPIWWQGHFFWRPTTGAINAGPGYEAAEIYTLQASSSKQRINTETNRLAGSKHCSDVKPGLT